MNIVPVKIIVLTVDLLRDWKTVISTDSEFTFCGFVHKLMQPLTKLKVAIPWESHAA